MGDVGRTHATWHQPLEAQAAIDCAVHWIVGISDVFLNTKGDLALLPCVRDAAGGFERWADGAQAAAMLGGTRMTSPFGLAT